MPTTMSATGRTSHPTEDGARLVLGVARLGERSLRGWWRTYGLDPAGRYVLEELYPPTWRSAALELDISSVTVAHDELLDGPTALHLFSDRVRGLGWPPQQDGRQTEHDANGPAGSVTVHAPDVNPPTDRQGP
jgi:hypothetical protein